MNSLLRLSAAPVAEPNTLEMFVSIWRHLFIASKMKSVTL